MCLSTRTPNSGLRVRCWGLFATWCGRALALSHARTGNPITLSGYMGKSDALDRAIASFSLAYADQNEKDYLALQRAIKAGKVKAEFDQEAQLQERSRPGVAP